MMWELGMATGWVFWGIRPASLCPAPPRSAPPRPIPNRTMFKFNKRVLNGAGMKIIFNKRDGVAIWMTRPEPAQLSFVVGI